MAERVEERDDLEVLLREEDTFPSVTEKIKETMESGGGDES
jgi:hypothetical protein